MTREILTTDQEAVEWTNKTGKPVFRTSQSIRVRNISLKQLNKGFLNSDFVNEESDALKTIRKGFNLQEWIPYYSFARDRVLNNVERKNIMLAQNTESGKYASFYEEKIDQLDTEFIKQKEEAEKLCPNKKVLAVLDPAEFDPINLGKKAKWLLDHGEKECIVKFRDCRIYIDGWTAITSAFNNKVRIIVTDILPLKTRNAEKYSNLICPFLFSENIAVSHGRGRPFGSPKGIYWLNKNFAYEENEKLEAEVPKTTAYHHSRIYSANQAIQMVREKLQVKDLLSLNIPAISYFAKQVGFEK
jgi:hypothetical protein